MAGIYRLKQFGLSAAAEDGVISARVAEEMERAADLVASAEARAAEIVAGAEAAFEAERQRGFAEGQAEAARAAAEALVAEHATLDRALAATESELADLVGRAVRQVIGRTAPDDLVLDTVRGALAQVRSEKKVQLHLPTESAGVVRDALDTLREEFPEIELFDLVEDASLQAPDVRLRSDLGVVQFVLDDTVADLSRLLGKAKG